jgi:SAM-dependent methyltransferase
VQPYSEDFYRNLKDGSIRSARVVIPILLQFVQPRTVIDVGCGIGTWLSVFRELTISDVWGVDGNYVDRERLLIPKERFVAAELTKSFRSAKTFDLVVSLEVGEHLPGDAAATFVETLTSLGPVVLFSAAIPFQGGTDHINEQWPEYWVRLFQQRGYVVVDCLRPKVWADPTVLPCYAQNVFLYVRSDRLDAYPRLQRELERGRCGGLSVVHPALYENLVNPDRCSLREALYFFYAVGKNRLRERLGCISNECRNHDRQ